MPGRPKKLLKFCRGKPSPRWRAKNIPPPNGTINFNVSSFRRRTYRRKFGVSKVYRLGRDVEAVKADVYARLIALEGARLLIFPKSQGDNRFAGKQGLVGPGKG